MRKILTLCIIHEDSRVLLGMKKRGFGTGRWNGFGGKVQDGESIEAAMIRETEEECGLTPVEFHKYGILEFSFENDQDILETHVFKCTRYRGTLGESEEMRPKWFSDSAIPFDDMWQDDAFWFPFLLRNKHFQGKYHFNAQHQILDQKLQKLDQF